MMSDWTGIAMPAGGGWLGWAAVPPGGAIGGGGSSSSSWCGKGEGGGWVGIHTGV